MATFTAEGRREEQSVEHHRLARAYLESKGVKLAWGLTAYGDVGRLSASVGVSHSKQETRFYLTGRLHF